MNTINRRQHSAEFKTNIVLEILKEEDTFSRICSKYSIHPTVARRWKDKALEVLKNSFSGQSIGDQIKQRDKLIEELYTEVGRLKYQLDWLKKKLGYTDS